MTRVWYNKSFSFVYNVIQLIKQQDTAQEFRLIVSHTQSHARALQIADESYLEPSGLVAKAYVDWCLAFCQQHKIDIFVVGKEAETIAQYQDLFRQQGVQVVLVADSDTLKLLEDKSRFAAHLPTEIAMLPETVTIQNLAQFELAYQDLRSRHDCLSIKPAISIFGLGFRKIDEKGDCLQHILNGDEYIVGLQELRHAMQQQGQFGQLLLMEFLDGDEWSVDCVADKGRLWAAIQRRKFMAKKGVPSQYLDDNPDIKTMCQQLTTYLKLSGQFNIQFRAGQKGIRLLEINARPSGGMAMACLSGINLPYFALKALINGYDSLPLAQPKTGIYVGEVSVAVALD
ncbi:MAG: ATP-grasp domain-containing protein [Agitococcus sp.]